jgi:pimeloyl-ACP methyl ester carboxylesterase
MADNIDQLSFLAPDGTRLVWREVGQGRPLVLLHGLFSDAQMNWIKFGHAARLLDAGHRVIMPDLRAHGDSDAPHDAAHYPNDILAIDVEALIAHLGLVEYDLGGFSLGARTCVRAVVRGLKPARLILGGMGLEGLVGGTRRRDFFVRAIDDYDTAKRSDDVWMAVQFMKSMAVDRVAARHLIAGFMDTDPDELDRVDMPTLVVCGENDQDNGSAERLAHALPDAHYVTVPGTHMSSVTEAALSEAMAAFLAT